MTWTAIVPLKAACDRKSRLAGVLDPSQRIALTERMAARMLAALAGAGVAPLLLSPQPHPGWPLREDRGTGLNEELEQARAGIAGDAVVVIHPDLPLVTAADVRALLDAAERHGVALAPDLAGTGTNAVALADGRPFPFRFGPGSFAAHRREAGPAAAICARPGLMLDVDRPEDFARALRDGF